MDIYMDGCHEKAYYFWPVLNCSLPSVTVVRSRHLLSTCSCFIAPTVQWSIILHGALGKFSFPLNAFTFIVNKWICHLCHWMPWRVKSQYFGQHLYQRKTFISRVLVISWEFPRISSLARISVEGGRVIFYNRYWRTKILLIIEDIPYAKFSKFW